MTGHVRIAAHDGGDRVPRWERVQVALIVAAMAMAGVVITATEAQALPLTISVTVTRVAECCDGGPIDATSPADFYGRTTVGGKNTDFGEITDDSEIEPDWRATNDVDHTASTTDATIAIFDEDDGLNFRDNQIDLTSTDSDRAVNITIDLHSPNNDCTFSGDVSGVCNQEITTNGNADDGDVAQVTFKVEVSEPAQAAGRHVSCLHAPLWPQAGNPVTITAASFGDQPDGQALPPLLADRVEVWFSTDGGVTRQIAASSGRQTSFSTVRTAGAPGSTFSYGCRVVDGGAPIYSGWRSVQVGDPPDGRAIPVLLNTDRENALDFVLFPATTNVLRAPNNPADTNLLTFPVYTGARDTNFVRDVGAALVELYREQRVLDNQRAINVWLAPDGAATGGTRDLLLDSDGDGMRDNAAPDTTGDGIPDGDGITDTCQHVLPANLGTDYGFGNVRAILHPVTPAPGDVNTLRECARGGVFSAEAGETGVFIHETGHVGWGLADEYAPDGGYFQANPNPNTYLSLAACTADVGNLGGVAGDCRGMDSVFDTDTNPDFWVSDPASNDLMNDNQFARRADNRRIDFVFGTCNQAKC